MAWALKYDGINDFLNIGDVNIPSSTPFELEVDVTVPSDFSRPFGSSGGNTSRILIFNSSQSVRLTDSAGSNASFTAPSYIKTDYNKFLFVRDASNNVTFSLNGTVIQTISGFSGAFSINQLNNNGISSVGKGNVKTIRVSVNGVDTNLWDATASSHAAGTPILTDTVGGNDATGVNMPTDGSAWVDLGGGVTVTGATPSFNYSSIAASIDLTGSIDITGQTANYTYSAANGAVDLTGDISITGATASYNYQSINGVVDLTGEITVIGLTPSQSYSSVSGIIELGAVISVVGVTPNYNYQGIAGEVSLNGEILVSGETPSYSYSAIKGFVTTGEAQAIGTVTSSFASDVYSSGFKPNTITVNFKS